MHMNIIDNCYNQFQQKDLKEIGEIEQSLATGLDANGKEINSSKILYNVATKIINNPLDEIEKLRLILVATVSLEISEKDRKNLTDKLQVSH